VWRAYSTWTGLNFWLGRSVTQQSFTARSLPSMNIIMALLRRLSPCRDQSRYQTL